MALSNRKRTKDQLKNEFEEFLRSGKSILPPEKSAQLLEKLHNSIATSAPARKTWVIYTRWAAAAMVLLMAGAGWRYYHTGHTTDLVSSPVAVKENTEIVLSNNSDTVRNLVLSDSSAVELSQGSSISYNASFNKNRRDIRLSGSAIFEVSKDAARPFTVYAGGISTTVLGTRFMMSTQQQNKVSVKLFEGKVVIRSTAGTLGMKDVYLNAGEQFVLDNRAGRSSVKSFKETTGHETTIPDTVNITLEFNQEPLRKVLASIGKQYNVQFKFSDGGFNNMLVTGKLLPSDSLDVVLSMLGNINGLSFKKVNNNTIEVTRIQ